MHARFIIILLYALLGFGHTVFGQLKDEPQNELRDKLRNIPISINFEDVPFHEVFEQLQLEIIRAGSPTRIAFDAVLVREMRENPKPHTKGGITIQFRESNMEHVLNQVCAAFNVRWSGSGRWVVVRGMAWE